MDEIDLVYFKNVLTRQLREVQNQVDGTVIDLINRDARTAEFTDMATIESERAYTLRMRSRESRLIKKIKQSLEDIANESYGICRRCGKEISVARLKARPVANHCIRCKNKMEQLERAAGF
jgi:DnaK suppressor protein